MASTTATLASTIIQDNTTLQYAFTPKKTTILGATANNSLILFYPKGLL